jgi:hypothetical protein
LVSLLYSEPTDFFKGFNLKWKGWEDRTGAMERSRLSNMIRRNAAAYDRDDMEPGAGLR